LKNICRIQDFLTKNSSKKPDKNPYSRLNLIEPSKPNFHFTGSLKKYFMNNSFTRRKFLTTTALASAALAFDRVPLNLRPASPGLQLWSVRDDLNKATAETVKALAGYGYKMVEGFGYQNGKMFGMPALDFVKLLKDNGIHMPSIHTVFGHADYDPNTKMLADSAKKTIDELAGLGVHYIVNAYMVDKDRNDAAHMTKLYGAAGAQVHKAGLKFGYHNHNFEFTTKGPDGRLLIEWLLQEVDPKIMDMEMDIYWVYSGGYNPLDWFRIYPGRWKLCHVKDMAAAGKHESIEVGDGMINFNEVFKHRVQAGLQYYIIELEDYKTTPLQGVKKSRENFMKLVF
jgi:sugar phosphate isomerase/epimerase